MNPEDNLEEFGYITVIENVFGFKQVLPLQEGDNVIGRRCVGTVINTPIESGDMSMDRRHCIINVKRNKQGKLVYTLRDAPSLTGTFLMNEILGDKDRVRMEDGAIVTMFFSFLSELSLISYIHIKTASPFTTNSDAVFI